MTKRSTSGPAAAAWIAAAAVLAWAGSALAFDPEPVPEPIGWRLGSETPSLMFHPLRSLWQDEPRPLDPALREAPRVRSEAEWSPLYSGSDGARIESARRTLALSLAPHPGARLGIELESRLAIARGGSDRPWLGIERARSMRAAAGASWSAGGFAVAGAALTDHERAGFAAEARATIGRRAQVWTSWSRTPEAGRVAVKWDEADVLAAGRWIDQRVAWRLITPVGPAVVTFGQEALDRCPSGRFGESARDVFQPTLAWRASMLDAALGRGGARWTASLRYGEGRERLQLWRGAPYGTVVGRVYNALAISGWEPRRTPIALRAWGGRWSGTARGAVALWPFDPLATLAGTRRVAVSSGSVAHAGVSLDRTPPARVGWDAGLALCRIAPRAHYESWLAELLGQGRHDASDGETGLRSASLAGARLAGTFEVLGLRTRLELVQWIPFHVDRTRSGSTEPDPGGGNDGGGSTSAARGDRGGTVMRVSVQSLR